MDDDEIKYRDDIVRIGKLVYEAVMAIPGISAGEAVTILRSLASSLMLSDMHAGAQCMDGPGEAVGMILSIRDMYIHNLRAMSDRLIQEGDYGKAPSIETSS